MEEEKKKEPTYNDVQTLLEWTAPGRPFRRKDKTYFATSLMIMFFVEVLLFIFSQYMLMAVVASFVFVAFALATVPPHDLHYRISTEGIFVEDHFYLWHELYFFYIKNREGQDVIYVRTHAFIPGELTLTLGTIPVQHAKSILLSYLPFREFIKPTFIEKAGEWLAKTFPLESTAKVASK